MTKIVVIFAPTMLLSGAMVNPEGLPLLGLLAYAAIMLILMPFIGWPVLAQAAIFPPAGESRTRSILATWIGGTSVAVSVIFWIASVLDYDASGRRVDWSAHAFIPYWPRFGIGLGLFGMCMLMASGVAGVAVPLLGREAAIRSAVIGGMALFAFVYMVGCVLMAR